MRKLAASVGIPVLGLSLACVGLARADERFKGPDEDGTKPALAKIAGEGMMNSKWQLWRGWKRGSAEAELLSPTRHKLHVDAMGWTGSTPAAGVEGEVVAINLLDLDQEMKDVSRLKSKVVLVVYKGTPKKSLELIFAQFGDFLRAAAKAGALVVIGGQGGSKASGLNLTHTGILGFDADFAIPVMSMTAEDQGQLERYVDAGVKPRARFNVQNTFTNGPVDSANVVGEIRGHENPEQVLVVGAHLDSWDLSEGTTDNGTGSASVLAAADAIVRSGMKPRRTIRFVLFTGEEQGLDGSFAYVKQHQSEMANHLGQHEPGLTGLQVHAPFGGGCAGGGQAGRAYAKRYDHGYDRVLDSRPAGAVCESVACGTHGEDAEVARAIRHVESV